MTKWKQFVLQVIWFLHITFPVSVVAQITRKRCFKFTQELRTAVRQYIWGSPRVRAVYGRFINDWCVSQIEDFSYLFNADEDSNLYLRDPNFFYNPMAYLFNEKITNWNTTSAKNMSYMFNSAVKFNSDIGAWNVSQVLNMNYMFKSATEFNQDLSRWNVSSVKSMQGMFYQAANFNQNISSWHVSNVTDMSYMFNNAKKFDQNLSSWNVTSLIDMTAMFQYSSFNHSLCLWGSSLSSSATTPVPPSTDVEIRVTDAFKNSSCPITLTPNVTANPKGPFCYNCSAI